MKSRQFQLVVVLAAAVCVLAGIPSIAAASASAAAHTHVGKHHALRDVSLDSQEQLQQFKRTFHVRTRKSVLDQAIAHVAQAPGVTLDIWSIRAVAGTDSDDPEVDATIRATQASMQVFQRTPLATARTTDGSTTALRMHIAKHVRSKDGVTITVKNVSTIESILALDEDDRSEQELIAADRREVAACRNRTDGFLAELARTPPARYTASAFFDCFRTHEHVFAFFDTLVAQNRGVLTKLPNVSHTLEGRSIPAYRLSAPPTTTTATATKKSALYTQALIHAREWQSGAATAYALAHLVDELRRGSATVTALLREFDWYFVPVVNIDGFVYSDTVDRYWRTNRRVVDATTGTQIAGVDLNRNFGPAEYFNRKPETNDAETNPGTFPLSEPATAGLFRFVTGLPKLRGVVDVHGFGGQVLRPFSNGASPAPKPFGSQLKTLGDGVAASISKHTNVAYVSDTGASLYEAYGCFDDAMFLASNYTVPAITIEVEGDDFIAPQRSIRRVGASIYHGLVRFAHEVAAYSNVVARLDSDSDSSE